MELFAFVHFCTLAKEQNSGSCIISDGLSSCGEHRCVGSLYFTRQAASLLKFAKATSNPELAAVLVQKAADLKSQIEAPKRTFEDKSPVAPDVE